MIAPSTSQESRRYDYPANPAGHAQLHHAQGHDLSMSDNIKQWLEQLGLGQYSNAFAENEIGFGVLAELDQETLKELGVTAIGHRLAIIKAAKGLQPDQIDQTPAPVVTVDALSLAAAEPTHAERRQLTVMFCDLVGSTALSGQLDPEDLREVVRAYQKSAEAVIQRYGGHIAQYLGDGLLVYFGYPVAHEDDAQRAVYAGVGIPKAIDGLNAQLETEYAVSLSVRIGIHTGPVVVGEMGGNERQENLAMGETPNLAARLEALAQPGSVVISENTRRLLGELFALEPLGEQNLKGIAAPVKAFAVTGERLAETRFAAGQSDGVSAMVGRQQELALLLDRWRQAKAGEGQMVVLSGEAGIGKSRIMSALVAALKPEDHLRISYQCSPYHTDSALYPAIQQLTYAGGFGDNESPEAKVDKLEKLLHQSQDDIAIAAPLLGALLGLGEAAEARYGALEYSPQQRRDRTLKVLLDQLTGAARKRPVLFVLEDAHWIDPTTLELIELALEQIGEHRIMLLITARPTFNHGFGGHPIVSRLALNRLGREQIIGIVDRITKGKTLPPELLDEIAAKTDGVPLFAEEFTKTLLESGQLRETEQGYHFDGKLDRLTIPSSLHDSLMARLDRMKPIKEVAQTAACVGRNFGYGLLAAVSPLPQAELAGALDQLVSAELLFKRGVPPESTYTFKHALVRDAAYESLPRRRREALHEPLR
jgi:class 3 adenylate cyclase/energy-coupling factor transporter ATP-binding protein EcfA2